MAEVVGAVASVLALCELAAKANQALKQFQRAPKEINKLQVDAKYLQCSD
jgi:hypothetical protein